VQIEFWSAPDDVQQIRESWPLKLPLPARALDVAYKNAGRKVGTEETQNARLYKECKDRMAQILKPGGIAVCCGWNSMGFGLNRGFELLHVLLVAHGAAHNDTIVTVEQSGAARQTEQPR
jgi:hypothetical protein